MRVMETGAVPETYNATHTAPLTLQPSHPSFYPDSKQCRVLYTRALHAKPARPVGRTPLGANETSLPALDVRFGGTRGRGIRRVGRHGMARHGTARNTAWTASQPMHPTRGGADG
ncbi:hypothetical protein DL769_001647 [Monosporascus sp. CRB-8-3]|nr:hypothetical protein DL769_001647 [Monosporascus sp. CRB-8-3]